MNGLRDDFGDYIMGKIDYFEVCEYYDALGVAIVRCNLDVYKYLCYVIVTKGQLGKLQVGMRILFTSGVLKKAKRAYLAHLASAKAPSALPAEP
ncbi:hypothetical protein PAPHI01_2161 [Pancytospora philotis]|nr:hypothetical protein PAPHI01_2161 [Pancytospora philotis]